MDKKKIEQVLMDAGVQLRREVEQIDADFLLMFYPFPKQAVAGISSEGRRQIEARCTRAVQETFHQAVKEAQVAGIAKLN